MLVCHFTLRSLLSRILIKHRDLLFASFRGTKLPKNNHKIKTFLALKYGRFSYTYLQYIRRLLHTYDNYTCKIDLVSFIGPSVLEGVGNFLKGDVTS